MYEYLLNVRVWWYTVRLASAVDLWEELPFVPRNLYGKSLEIEMQRSFPFWRVGNNEHEGIWEDIPSYMDLRPGFKGSSEQGENSPHPP